MGLKIEATETNLLGAHQFAQFYNGALSIFSFDNWGGQAINQYINHYSTGNPPGALVINLQENGTGLNAGTELSSVQFILNANKQWSTGAITNQREFYIQAPTYSFVGASTIATAATVAISGAPLKGTNATLTNTSALLLQGTYTITTASTTVNELAVVATFNSSANNGAFCAANLRYTVNQTGTASGTISGLLVNATETAVLGTHNLLNLQIAAVSRFTVDRFGNTTIAQVAEAALVPTALTVTGGAHTNITLSTEDVGINFNLSATKQWATGALSTQREVLVQAPTYAFVGASTLTTAVTFDITGAPVAGANATITNSYALRVEAGSSQFVPTKTVVATAGSVWHGLDVAAATLTVTGATTPITALTFANIGSPTVSAASAIVVTDFYTLNVGSATFAGGGPASATNNWALGVNGATKFTLTEIDPLIAQAGYAPFTIKDSSGTNALLAAIATDKSFWLSACETNLSVTYYPIVINPFGGGLVVGDTGATLLNSTLRVNVTKSIGAATGAAWNAINLGGGLTVTGATTPITKLRCVNLSTSVATSASPIVVTDFYQMEIGAPTFAGSLSATRAWSLKAVGNVQFGAGQQIHATDVNVAGPYVVLATDYALEVRRTATAAISINLPSIATVGGGWILISIDSGYNAAVNNITLVRNGADTINNVAGNYVQNVSGSAIWLKANATTNNWEII